MRKTKNAKNIKKNYIWPLLSISSLTSLIIILFFTKFGPDIRQFPLASMELSLPDKAFLVSYITLFTFLICSAASFIVLFIYHIVITRFLKIKISPVRGYILSFWICIVIYCALVISLKFLHCSSLSNLLLIPFYLFLSVTIFLIQRWIRKAKDTNKLIVSTSAVFIALVISTALFNLLDTKYTSPLTKENILLAGIFLIGSGLVGILCYYFVYKISFWLAGVYNKIAYAKVTPILNILKALIILYIGLSITLGLFGFFWENKETSLVYRELTSQTKEDINVILIVIDALRADHLGCYGYPRETSPYIDVFAKEQALFKHCYTQASWTKPSVASIFTSLYPTMHQTILRGDALPDEVTTLAELIHQQGYITYSYVANPSLKVIFNFNQGFDFFDDYLMRDKLYYVALRNLRKRLPLLEGIIGNRIDWTGRDNIKLANKRIIPWLKKYKDENFFMYIHYMDPHAPYSPPRPYKNMFPYDKKDNNSKNISLYDGEIRFADEHIGKLFAKLKSLGIYDKTLIIITADHGEAFGEHGDYAHGHTIYQEQLWVPLIVKHVEHIPQGRIIETQVRSIEIMPTILDALNISYAGHLEGTSLLPLLRNKEEMNRYEDIFIEQNYNHEYILKGILRNNIWKYIFTEESKLRDVKKLGAEELYNLVDDPGELNNLVRQEAKVLKIMRAKLDFYKRYCEERAVSPSEKELDYETLQQLKSLGYIQ